MICFNNNDLFDKDDNRQALNLIGAFRKKDNEVLFKDVINGTLFSKNPALNPDRICFVDKATEMWKDIDVLITTDPEILQLGAPWGQKLIKVKRPYNENIKSGSLEILQIAELYENPEFEKIIKFKN